MQNKKDTKRSLWGDNVDTEYNMRLNSYSSYVTDFIIHPIQDEKQQRDVEYPLFFVLNRSLGINLEKVLKKLR